METKPRTWHGTLSWVKRAVPISSWALKSHLSFLLTPFPPRQRSWNEWGILPGNQVEREFSIQGNRMREHLWILTSGVYSYSPYWAPHLHTPMSALHSPSQCPHLALSLLSSLPYAPPLPTHSHPEHQPPSTGLTWFFTENVCRPLLWTIVSRSPGW